MERERWMELDKLFDEAVKLPPAECVAFIHQVANDDEHLKKELESLLASHSEADSFLEALAIEQIAASIITKPAAPLVTGQTIGHYEIIAEIGKGGQGAVYKAFDPKLNRTIAIKTLPYDFNVDETSRKRFEREAQLASSLDHPNICTVHDLANFDGTYFIVLQFVDGKNIRQLVDGRPLELRSALRIAVQVCDALANAHAAGIIHRDIKAHNIIVTDAGVVKVLDFGLAKVIRAGRDDDTELTVLGSPYGTPTYAAPEQSRGELVDHRADIFSTGVLLYELLTGTWAFHGKTAVDVRHAVLHDQPKPVTERRGEELPKELLRIVDRALQKEPKQRYQAISEMRDELIEVLRSLPDVETSEDARFLDNFKPMAPRNLRLWGTRTAILSVAAVILFIVLGVVGSYWVFLRNSPNGKIKTIAVLPFKPLGEPKDEFLELGMADALISRMSRVQQITVRPTSAVLKFAATQDAVGAGRDLQVDAVLDGRIQRVADKLRVTVQLIRVSDGTVLWFGKFDEDFKGIFAVQDSIADRMFNELALKLSTVEQQQLAKRSTENTAAYQSYLKGRYFWNKFSGPNSEKAIEHFQRAIDEDPSFAPAYAGLADAYELQGYLNIKAAFEVYPLARSSVEKAMAIDDQLAEAHLVLAKIKLFYDWDIKAAEEEITRALALAPNIPDAHGFHGVCLVVTGDFDGALAARIRMQELDPTSAFAALNVGWSYFYKHEYDKAIEQYREALELDPQFATVYESLGQTYAKKEMPDEAIASFLREKELVGVAPDRLSVLSEAFRAHGLRGFWQQELELAEERGKQGQHKLPRRMARIYTELGQNDKAFEWLDKALVEHTPLLIFLKTDPTFDPLRLDPRYDILLQKIGLR
ncbi:MAG: protein kinase [Pyrinomonadaceae bacterium]